MVDEKTGTTTFIEYDPVGSTDMYSNGNPSSNYCNISASDWPLWSRPSVPSINSSTFSSISCVILLYAVFKQAVVSICVVDFRCEVAEQQNCLLNDQSIKWVHTYLLFFLSTKESPKQKIDYGCFQDIQNLQFPWCERTLFPYLSVYFVAFVSICPGTAGG